MFITLNTIINSIIRKNGSRNAIYLFLIIPPITKHNDATIPP